MFVASVLLTAELNYLQGYNDIAARFLVVLESEVDCYWVFKLYVENRKADFSETGMIHRTGECCVYAHTQDACTYARTQTTHTPTTHIRTVKCSNPNMPRCDHFH